MSVIQVGAVVGTACVSSKFTCYNTLTPKRTGSSGESFERCLDLRMEALMSGISTLKAGLQGDGQPVPSREDTSLQ